MSLKAKTSGGQDFELIPEDQHAARCVLVVDIGTQDSAFGSKHQCIIGWELPDVLRVFDQDRGEEPAMISQFYTLSLHEKSRLRQDLERWRGRQFTADDEDFDLTALLGAPCLLQVVHAQNRAGNMRAKIQTIGKLPKGMNCADQHVKSRSFDLDSSTADDFSALPGWIQDRIKVAAEYPSFVQRTASHLQPADEGETVEDGVPF